jgi:hypothetical protein
MTAQVAGGHAHVKRLVSIVKRAIVLEECTIEEQRSAVRFFLWTKRLNGKGIHKEMFPVYGWKCLSRKAVHSWVANVSLMTKRLKRSCGSG